MNTTKKVKQFSRGDVIAVDYESGTTAYGVVASVEVGRDDDFTPYHIYVDWLHDALYTREIVPPQQVFVYDRFPIRTVSKKEVLRAVDVEIDRITKVANNLLNIAP